STEALRQSSLALVEAYPGLHVRAYAGDYFDVLESHAVCLERKTLAMLMGSNVGNYEPDEARELLRLLGEALRPGDGLLLGADLKKDRATLELAYNDPAGVTAAFNRNVLARINRELDADFDVRNFKHVAQYDEARGSVDSFLEARDGAVVSVRSRGLQIQIRPGERIHTESSYKFTDDEIVGLAAAGGFMPAASWRDRAGRFAVHLLVRE
ncbi:MAG TPA: L-histidine N(alpha)-methyltransferase, partial [Candidatus Cybelea sp.]|nr:L-histidine N(alpha)-methyltransferase [Candidatus Cybelea sp.]